MADAWVQSARLFAEGQPITKDHVIGWLRENEADYVGISDDATDPRPEHGNSVLGTKLFPSEECSCTRISAILVFRFDAQWNFTRLESRSPF